MSAFGRWMQGREYITLLLNWRWLVLAIAIPVSLVIELLEGRGEDLHLLDEVILDGLVLPFTTWIVLTFAARRMAVQYERAAALERRQQFARRLAEHREYYDLAHFLVRFPASLLPVEHVALEVLDPERGQLRPVTEWSASGAAARQQADYRLLLIHGGAQIGVLKLSFARERAAAAAQKDELASYGPDIATALAHAIEAQQHARTAYMEARAYERRRITQELHDSLAQQVFYLHLGLDQLADDASLTASEAVGRKLASMRDVAADVYEQIRSNLAILRAWEQVNLTEAVTDLARVTARNAAMAIDIDVQGESVWLPPHTCEQAYGVVREALNNVVKHARAGHVRLELDWAPDRLVIRLRDDGVGFDPEQPPEEGHFGLALMREAIDALEGRLTIESRPGEGTRLTISLPLQPADTSLRPSQLWPTRFHDPLGSSA